MPILLTVVGVLLFNLVMLIHELGHFLTAKKFGVQVNEFALGMGPRIFKFQKGETVFSLRAIPIGGFCEMEGEEGASKDPRSFGSKPAWQRAIIIVAGAIVNLILGFIITLITLCPQEKFPSTTVSKFSDPAITSQHGLMVGDKIISVDGSKIINYDDLNFCLKIGQKSCFDLDVERNGKIISLKGLEFYTEPNKSNKPMPMIDFKVEPIEKNFFSLMDQSFKKTASTVKMVWLSLKGIISGKFSLKDMAGPVGIAHVTTEVASEALKTSNFAAFMSIISMMAMLTINLGILNLLPIPALDGGRLVFILFEMITRKRINEKYENLVNGIGFILLLLLIIILTFNDIARIFRGPLF